MIMQRLDYASAPTSITLRRPDRLKYPPAPSDASHLATRRDCRIRHFPRPLRL